MPNNNNSTNIRTARKKKSRQLCDIRELCCELSSGRNARGLVLNQLKQMAAVAIHST